MKHLVIIGAGGYGREMFGAALESVGFGTAFDVRGYLDARSDALADFKGYPPVIGSPETYEPEADDVFITALGSIASRRRCVELVKARGGTFVSIVHRTAVIERIGRRRLVRRAARHADGGCLRRPARRRLPQHVRRARRRP